MKYIRNIEIRWSDLDPNYHLRHSAYYDFGAYCRICFLHDNGITTTIIQQNEIGPVLFREECAFKKEIVFGDTITITLKLKSVSPDFRKFSMVHEIYKNGDQLAAIVTVDGAWMNTKIRRIITPPAIVIDSLNVMEKTDDFKMQ